MKTPTYNTPFTVSEGSHLRYIAVKDASGKQVARVPWEHQDNDLAQLFALAPEMLPVLQYTASLPLEYIGVGTFSRLKECESNRAILSARRILDTLSRASA